VTPLRVGLAACGCVAFIVLVDRAVDRLYPASRPAGLPSPSTAHDAGGSVVAPAGASADPGVVFFDGGYAVGSAREIERVIAARVRGSHTACEQPPPTAEERARWKPLNSELSSVPLSELLRRSDLDLVTEVSSRLLNKEYGAGFDSMSRPEQNVYLVSQLEGEIDNGGLDQFFVNSAGNCALRTAVALDEMGRAEEAEIFRGALALFPDAAPSEDRATRFDQLDALGGRRSRWDSMDRKLESVLLGTATYIREHALAFALPP